MNESVPQWLDAERPEAMLYEQLKAEFGKKVYHWGCQHSHALNYNPEANMAAGNCVYADDQPHSWLQ